MNDPLIYLLSEMQAKDARIKELEAELLQIKSLNTYGLYDRISTLTQELAVKEESLAQVTKERDRYKEALFRAEKYCRRIAKAALDPKDGGTK
jgi:hypothetical protein